MTQRLGLSALLALSVLASGCGTQYADPIRDPFVRRSGSTLVLEGRPFRFVGANAWGVGWADGGCQYDAFSNEEAALAQTFGDLSEMGVQALRVWAFQSFAGASGNDYSALDAVVHHARAAGVRLIFVLENFYTDCSKGKRDDAWFQSGFQQPYGGYALSMPDYVRGLVAHFRDEPTIMAWELLHEAGANDVAAFLNFYRQMSAQVRSADANHLIILGTDNGDTPATSTAGNPSPYVTLQGLDTVDLIDTHDFFSADVPLSDSEQTNAAIAAALGKPCFVGASAVSLSDGSAASFSERAARVASKGQGVFDAGLQGYLLYAYTPSWKSASFDFDGRSEEPLAGPNGVLGTLAASVRPP